MRENTISTTIEILGKYYPVRCLESEVEDLQKAAQFLNQEMTAVQDSGKVINLERIAIITALNIAHQFMQLDQQKSSMVNKINQRITQLQHKLEKAVSNAAQTDLIYNVNE